MPPENTIQRIPPAPDPGKTNRIAVLRRMRGRRIHNDEEVEIDLSPLIDCVFLLLIFFLVTTMFKKLERQIPMETPDFTSSIASVPHTETVIYGLDRHGDLFRAREGRRNIQGLVFDPVDSLAGDLQLLARSQGTAAEIRLDVEREVSVQRVVDTLDTLALQGFENVGLRILYLEKDYFELRRRP
ncbi:MAG: biopolymer transporter ExbD [Opitutales bacterium]